MAWNIKDLAYSRSFSVAPQTYDGLQMFLSPDGTKLYVTDPQINQRIYEYTLSEAWNITTASYVHSKSFDQPYGLWLSPDGTKLYFYDAQYHYFRQHTLSTPWDITSATSAHELIGPDFFSCLFLNSDGTKLFALNDTENKVVEYTLGTAWNISTAALSGKDFYIGGQSEYTYGLFFHPDGTKMYISGHKHVYQYALSTPWDISTAVWTWGAGLGYGQGLSFKPDGTRLYTSSIDERTVREFDILASDYYVKPDGNDALDGESEANAWATIDHAQNNIGERNTVHIAAGTYDESDPFTFDPPVGSKWMGAGRELTKLFTSPAIYYTIVVQQADVEIHGCQVGDDPGGAGSGPQADINADGFVMQDCSMRCTMLSFMAPRQGIQLINLTGGLAFFVCMSNIENSTFIGLLHVLAAGQIFTVDGSSDNNTFADIDLPENEGGITCPTGSMDRCVFKSLTLSGGPAFTVDDLEIGTGGLTVNGPIGQAITNCKSIGKLTVASSATLLITWYQQKFYETSDGRSTGISTVGDTFMCFIGACSNVTFTERPFLITADGSVIYVLVTDWQTTGDQNKTWTVEATGSRTITFQLGDMLANRKYQLMVDGEKVSHAKSNASGVVEFPEYSGTFSTRTFTAELTPPLLTHDEIRTAIITTLQADSDINAEIETWLRYLINTGQITYPAIYVGEIMQPFDGACGTEVQHTSIADPMEITVGVLSNTHEEAVTELGTLYEMVFDVFKDDPTLSLKNFRIHSISPIITAPIPKCGRSVIRAEMTLNATWVRSND